MTETLEEYVRRKRSRGIKAVMEAYSDYASGRIELVDPNPPDDFISYLRRPEYSLWFWTSLAFLALTLASVRFIGGSSPLRPLRYLVGSLYVLFMPGYSLIEALYPHERELSPLERVALSIGLSLAVVPLIGLILNYTPWGIRLWPIVISMSIFIVSMLLIASYRKFRIAATIPKAVS